MKKLKLMAILVTGLFLMFHTKSFSQNKKVVVHKTSPGKKHHAKNLPNKKVVVVYKSKFRPAKVVVYHPVWAPTKNINRRWVYFPKYNCYWDNWRNVYYYKNNNVWISSSKKPTIIINVNLENEKHYELNEIDDDDDEIYIFNANHITIYK